MAIQKTHHEQVYEFDLLSQCAQEALRTRVIEAGGSINSVRRSIQEILNAVDNDSVAKAHINPQTLQADRAFLVAQLAFLDFMEQEKTVDLQPPKRSFWERILSRWRGSYPSSQADN